MKHFKLFAFVLAVASCSSSTVSTGDQTEGDRWLFTGKGPYNLETKLNFAGKTYFQLVTDLSLMAPEPEVVLEKEVAVGQDSILKVKIGKLNPGFYQVRLDSGKVSFNIGIRPEEVISKPDSKPDFASFWESTLSALDTIPMNVSMTEVPEYSNDIRTTYNVSFTSLDGALAGGIVCIPAKPGKYPVYIQYMGYGADVYYFDPSANADRIDYLVSVRGQGIFREPEGMWIDRGLSSKETQYYRGAYADVKRAIDFASSLEKADPGRMVAYGESQGGAFSIVSAALDSRIKAIAPAVPFMADFPDYGKIVWWPVHEFLQAADAEGLPHEGVYDVMSYFDTKNFAPMVKCPVYMAFGLQDPTCPPHTNFAIYNNLGSKEKHYIGVPTCGHGMWERPEWPPVREQFLANHLK